MKGGTAVLAVLLFWLPWITLARAGSPDPTARCSGAHRPGDLITCYITFEAKSNFSNLQVQFNLPREDEPRQHGSFINFILRDTQQIDDRTYMVSGLLPDCVPGTYILAAVIATSGRDWQQYINLAGPSIVVENDSGDPMAIEAQNKGRKLSVDTRIPEIVETPPPDPATFPAIVKIGPAKATSDHESGDLVSLVGKILGRSATPSSCGGSHKPGDNLDCRVTFQGQPEFQTVALHFTQFDGKLNHIRKQQCIGIGLGTQGKAVRGPDGAYSLTGIILRCGAGRYRLLDVGAFGYSGNDSNHLYFRNYVNGSDFKSDIVLTIKDTGGKTFPAIVSVAETPAER
jgi:hypothetical protein